MRLTILLLLISVCSFAAMKREELSYNGIKYLKYTPTTMPIRGAVLFLHGLGERGTNLSLLENTEIPKQLKNGLEVPYIVVCPQLPSSYAGWYGNITYPIIDLMKTYNLDLHITGLSAGGMIIPTLVYEKMGTFKTAATICGQVDGTIRNKILPEMGKIPSIHYYDPNDYTISYGYLSVKDMVETLKLQGKDIDLIKLTGSPNAHSIWPQAYQTTQYWKWLDSKTTTVPVTRLNIVKTEVDVATGRIIHTDSNGKEY